MKRFFFAAALLTTPVFAVEPVPQEMFRSATALIESLDAEQREKISFPFDSPQRENWGYIPRERKGLPLESMNEKQIALSRDLLKSALSDPGLEKVDAVIALEAFLRETENRPQLRNPKAYFFSIHGKPEPKGTWSWRMEGHHLSLNYTIVHGAVKSVTPSFFASNPAEVRADHPMKGFRPFHAEEDLARILAVSLLETKKAVVFSEKPPGEILTREDRKVKQLDPVGVLTAEMSAAQKKALLELIEVYATRHRKELADETMKQVTADFANLRFGWAGSLERGQPYYYRIQGTDFLVEVANVQGAGNHFHSVWRDAKNDFGRDVLSDHIDHDH